ncbi:mandelate racemase/muconate lactonizing enzyme family protein [Micromonospora sp. R77]|uniref:mandelate racemase/muconate lactonizing enzyme family protein n=1 Tax=Micromonospora sp. R77 TaxID=2925836 RepID=UPI001F610417|nr:mandelate racemase/muconate lactonizing enzyme family protein [Micromonospora sp. R77]MCI4061331.1 mandelate racemase/muconate lactonizing enzyme family protein [Micromonospora sp. R77]
MKISHVRTYVVRQAAATYLGDRPEHALSGWPDYRVLPPRNTLYPRDLETLIVSVHTDDGLVGWGEALTPVGTEAVATLVTQLLTPALLGEDPAGVAVLQHRLRQLMRVRGHLSGHQADAVAAVDIALWDLRGRALGVPVHELLGGAFRTVVPSYRSGLTGGTDDERAAAATRAAAEEGMTAVKLHLGAGVEADLATYDAVAAAVPGVRIALDAHWAYPLFDARRLAHGLDERGAWFLEAPLAPEDVEGHRELARAVRTPIAVGEALRSRYEAEHWLRRRALHICQPDIGRTGITEGMAFVQLCDAAHVPVAPHHSVAGSIALAAALHVCAATPELVAMEYQPNPFPVGNRLLAEPLRHGPDGFPVPQGPGLGIDIDLDTLAEVTR